MPGVGVAHTSGAGDLRSVVHLKGGLILRPIAAPVVDRGGADVGVAQSGLNFGDVGLVLQGAGRDKSFHGNSVLTGTGSLSLRRNQAACVVCLARTCTRGYPLNQPPWCHPATD